ncbi:hypothetical protein EVAR_94511_1 [Eumeta japonica]|uniref:Uncharacterized protein n=1 Tax=Eumeta variegata TaxID=151549 RepID=A0A4C1UUM9_EUMVA|nr:hypothetical protein EVAR_94511_1 [Eumeta japonica]
MRSSFSKAASFPVFLRPYPGTFRIRAAVEGGRGGRSAGGRPQEIALEIAVGVSRPAPAPARAPPAQRRMTPSMYIFDVKHVRAAFLAAVTSGWRSVTLLLTSRRKSKDSGLKRRLHITCRSDRSPGAAGGGRSRRRNTGIAVGFESCADRITYGRYGANVWALTIIRRRYASVLIYLRNFRRAFSYSLGAPEQGVGRASAAPRVPHLNEHPLESLCRLAPAASPGALPEDVLISEGASARLRPPPCSRRSSTWVMTDTTSGRARSGLAITLRVSRAIRIRTIASSHIGRWHPRATRRVATVIDVATAPAVVCSPV